MRPGQLRHRAPRLAARKSAPEAGRAALAQGEVRNRKRMAETGAVFDIDPGAAHRAAHHRARAPGQPGPPGHGASG